MTDSPLLTSAPARAFLAMHRWAWVAMALMLAAQAARGADPVKFRIEIVGAGSLATMLRENTDLARWSTRQDVAEDQLRQLVKTAPEQVRSLLATEGYFSAAVSAELVRSKPEWTVRLNVTPGEPTRITDVEFMVTGAIESDPRRDTRIHAARTAFALQPGRIFRQAAWNSGKLLAVNSLHRHLYAAARITRSRADIDPDKKQARLNVEIESGPPFAFGDLQIRGLQRYEPSIVRNLSPIRPGEAYDEDALVIFQRRLLRSEYFASAVVSAGNDASQAAAVPITVNVVESPARKVELGAGFSTDRGPRFQAGYVDHNALDRAWRFNTHAKIDGVSSEVLGGLTFPRDAAGWRYGLEGRNNQQDIQGEKRTDWSVAGAHTYTVEQYESQQALQLVVEKRAVDNGPEDNRKATFLSQAWTWNRIDDALAPRAGFVVRLQAGGAAEQAGSDRSFGRLMARGSYLQPVGGFGTLLLRLETGAVFADSRENIPSVFLFRTGGDTTVRGYAFESLGVREGDAIVGGRYMAAGSIEYIQWLTRQWGVAAFYDAGNAVDERSRFHAAVGYGGGVRWHSPVGALNLDIAYGRDTGAYRLHFSVGFVF